jgi:hypothetical protein
MGIPSLPLACVLGKLDTKAFLGIGKLLNHSSPQRIRPIKTIRPGIFISHRSFALEPTIEAGLRTDLKYRTVSLSEVSQGSAIQIPLRVEGKALEG